MPRSINVVLVNGAGGICGWTKALVGLALLERTVAPSGCIVFSHVVVALTKRAGCTERTQGASASRRCANAGGRISTFFPSRSDAWYGEVHL